MAKVKVRVGYPSAALSHGLDVEAGDTVQVDEDIAASWVAQGWAELVEPASGRTVQTETADVTLTRKKAGK